MKNLLLTTILLLSGAVHAQTLEEQLARTGEDVARGYISPLTSAYASDLNSGWAYCAPAATSFSFDFDAGFIVAATLFTDENRKFSRSGSFLFDKKTVDQMTRDVDNSEGARDSARKYLYGHELGVTIAGPTIVGSNSDSIHVKFTNGNITFRYNGKDTTVAIVPADTALPVTGILDNISSIILSAPQISIGTVFGTKVTIRYLPPIAFDKEIGTLNYFGFGIQHNPFVWLPIIKPPIDVSVGYFTQKLNLGDKLKTTTTLVNVSASKTLGWGALSFTPFVSSAYESATIEMAYTYTGPDPEHPGASKEYPLHFSIDGENSVRLTLGASLKVGFIKASAEYNVAKYNSIAMALGVII